MSDAEPQHPYDRPSDPAKRHSAALTDGPDRAGARAMLKAIGFTDEDLAKPLVGVGTTWIETMPCNYNQRRLAEHVKDGIRAAGGTPMEFNTVQRQRRRVDGHRGHEGLARQPRGRRRLDRARRARPPARRRRLPGRLRQDDPGRGDGPRPARRAGRRSSTTGRSIRAPTRASATRPSSRSIEAIGAYRAGKITLDELYEIESVACPGPGACGGQYTANTMATVMEFLGLSPAGLNGIPAEDPAKDEAARRTGELVMDLVRRDVRPSTFVTRESLENGIATVAATGGSTNGVLHLLAIAHEFGIPLDIDEFGAIADRTPIVADMQPGRPLHRRRPVRRRRRRAGHARAAQARRPAPRRRADRRRPDDRRDRGRGASRPRARRSILPIETPAQADRRPGHPARHAGAGRLRGQAGRPRAAPASRPGPRVRLGGGLLRGGQGPPDRGRRRRRHPLRGPGRRAGHAGDAAGHRRRSSARAWATRSRSSPTAGSAAGPTA